MRRLSKTGEEWRCIHALWHATTVWRRTRDGRIVDAAWWTGKPAEGRNAADLCEEVAR